ncbi:MAG: ankyrin repeat domain-containing protein, partial [Gammaproteobacteria bacterium]|nr:ankyrin repeat domain-containing protein [Gammaproteobacteria bacterium]
MTMAWPSARLTLWVGAFLIVGATDAYGQEDEAAPLTLKDAIRDSDASAVKTLIDGGADVNEPELLLFAVLRGGVEIVELLVDAGADVNLAVPVPPDQKEGLLRVFGSDAEVVVGTPLSVAALMGRFAAADVLLEEGADPNVVTGLGTPIGLAAARGHTDVLKLLIEAGGDASGRSLTGTAAVMFSPLLLAARAGHVDAAELLVESG